MGTNFEEQLQEGNQGITTTDDKIKSGYIDFSNAGPSVTGNITLTTKK